MELDSTTPRSSQVHAFIGRLAAGPREFFDLEADPGEARNQLSAEPEVALRLASAWLSGARHEWPRAEPSIEDADRRGLEALGYTD